MNRFDISLLNYVTSLPISPNRLARLPNTKENSLICANAAAMSHFDLSPLGKIGINTNTPPKN